MLKFTREIFHESDLLFLSHSKFKFLKYYTCGLLSPSAIFERNFVMDGVCTLSGMC